jgi:hypothetical protein
MKALTKGQYEGIAWVIWRVKNSIDEYSREQIALGLSQTFGQSDPEFKRELFLSLCGVTE